MAKKDLEREIEGLGRLREATPENIVLLKKALSHRNNYYVSKAARVATQNGSRELLPALLAAYDRFFGEDDPQCWAKAATAQAAGELGHDESAAFLKGLRHVQMEAVWGGQKDVAGQLRAICALGLANCRDLTEAELFTHLVDLTFDPDKTVRIEVLRALGRVGGTQAALLLRMRALAGDKESEVFGTCLAVLLDLEGRAALDFVVRYLKGEDDEAAEAALAIATLRSEEGFKVLKERWDRGAPSDFGSILLHAMALTRCEPAIQFLRDLIRREARGEVAARKALRDAGVRETED